MNQRLAVVAFAAFTCVSAVFGQTTAPVGGPSDAFQVTYASNLNLADSVFNITNAGTTGGNICVSVYTFAPDEQLVSCCSCVVTPNGLNSLSARSDLISNTLTPAVPTSIVVKLVATSAASGCSPSTMPTASTLAGGMRAWGTKVHTLTTAPGGLALTETEFSPAVLSNTELSHITSTCGFIIGNGSGFGICNSCRTGGLGAAKN
jgi:hypothetical protein